ncbi:MAG: hypothetical protein PF445_00270 [Melioribacteraceae bacterium]|nr:hypothetical protein [Melioribacteraceae bacterium]
MNIARANYINFLYDSAEENIVETKKELVNAGLNPSKFQTRIEDLVAELNARTKIEHGKKLKELYCKIKAGFKEKSDYTNYENIPTDLGLAFRNIGDRLSSEEIEQILMDDMLLDELIERLSD